MWSVRHWDLALLHLLVGSGEHQTLLAELGKSMIAAHRFCGLFFPSERQKWCMWMIKPYTKNLKEFFEIGVGWWKATEESWGGGMVYICIWQIVLHPEPTVLPLDCGLFALAQLWELIYFLQISPRRREPKMYFDASVFLYAAHYSRILIKEKYSEAFSPLL